MSRKFEAGLYVFHPVDAPEGVNIATGPVPLPLPPPDVPLKVLKSSQRWLVKDGANGTFRVFAGSGNDSDYKWAEKYDALYASAVRRLGEGTDFTITAAGDNVWTIQIPNKDSLLTYKDGSVPDLTFRPADGSSGQRFEAIRIDRGDK